MFRFENHLRVFVHREAVDFRKHAPGLAVLVEQSLKLDPFAPALYVFGNRRRNRVKILGWHRNGFWLLTKRLEQERFVWPKADTVVMELTVQQLHWLLEGIDIAQMRGHRVLNYARVS